ncbi:MAG: 2,3-bisphosphoglycerate-independent phosphoglycerate mutase [Acidimicrobiia bacterium]|nr:2,3-bisphosphoglycerate-independent phosphoglycerate mutase [Acidimicrobiia bacterium]MBV9041484.1 2,3-bisphosphoglycerate-independent phosphoglycerate mutase [Acidimicrobiia bacterium]MBV9283793.1 2,3-bisphosphoglycerate-independent phosphoglycerate mutase [Acidimicrobiia bacterium]
MGGLDLSTLVQPADTRIVLVVMDGLGGYATAARGSELEEARTPNLDDLATQGSTGLVEPVGPGITPGSGPGHLGLFGYDPLEYELGRGALSAAGLDVELKPGDVAARGNLATLDKAGNITDRRAGRIPDDEAAAVVEKLRTGVDIDGVDVLLVPEAQHRVLVVLRGEGLDARVTDTDPQATGVPPLAPEPKVPDAKRTAEVVAELDGQVRGLLADENKANALLLRGFDSHRELPSMQQRYGVTPAAVAIYPMYRGIARLVGMEVLPKAEDLDGQVAQLEEHWDRFDYFFLHHKYTDSAGEDGDFDRKVAAVEALDAAIPAIVQLGPDVIVVTGDHATPSQMAAHSWHPVPALMWGERVGRDATERFGERWCAAGMLGLRPTKDLMPIALAAAGRLAKYGA